MSSVPRWIDCTKMFCLNLILFLSLLQLLLQSFSLQQKNCGLQDYLITFTSTNSLSIDCICDKCGTWSSNQTWNKAFGLLTRTMFSTCEAPSSSNKAKNNWDPDLYISKERKNHIDKRLRNKVSSSSGHEEEIELEIPVCSPPWVFSDSLFLPLSFPKYFLYHEVQQTCTC